MRYAIRASRPCASEKSLFVFGPWEGGQQPGALTADLGFLVDEFRFREGVTWEESVSASYRGLVGCIYTVVD